MRILHLSSLQSFWSVKVVRFVWVIRMARARAVRVMRVVCWLYCLVCYSLLWSAKIIWSQNISGFMGPPMIHMACMPLHIGV